MHFDLFNEASLRKESLASKLVYGDSKGFWKLIKGDSNARVPLPTSVEGVTGEANIANWRRTHYKDVLTKQIKGAAQPTMQFAMMCILIFRSLVMNYIPLFIIWTSIRHVALM